MPSLSDTHLHAIIDSRIDRTRHDDIGLRDFATVLLGGDYDPRLTSATRPLRLAERNQNCEGRTCLVQVGQKSPLDALTPGTHPKDCWPLRGTYGHLGITLSSNIVVTHVTIDNVVKVLALHVRTAPRNLKLWGILREPIYQERYRTHIRDQGRSMEFPQPPLARLDTSVSWMLLASMTYNISSARNIQTFSVPGELVRLGIPLSTVVLEINDNWGDPKTTCLYRVRVHSEPNTEV